MPTFRYEALDQTGGRFRGEIEASHFDSAQAALVARALTPLHLREILTNARSNGARPSEPLRHETLIDVLSDLGALVGAGVPLAQALDVLAEVSEAMPTRRHVAHAAAQLREGKSLTTILTGIGDNSTLLEGLIRVGQLSGDLGQALRHASDLLRRALDLRRQLWATLSYPAFVLAAFLVGFGVIFGFVVPALEPLVLELDAGQAPFLQFLVAARSLLAPLGSVVLALALGIFIFVLLLLFRGKLRPFLSRVAAQGPFARTTQELECGAWAVGAGRLVQAGATVPEAVLGACAFVRNASLRQQLAQMSEDMLEGATLGKILEGSHFVPKTIARVARVGERGGVLGPMLERAGEQTQSRAIRRITRVASVAAPIALLAMGGAIGLMIAGLLTGVAAIGDAALQ